MGTTRFTPNPGVSTLCLSSDGGAKPGHTTTNGAGTLHAVQLPQQEILLFSDAEIITAARILHNIAAGRLGLPIRRVRHRIEAVIDKK
jgi:hypothetical protein